MEYDPKSQDGGHNGTLEVPLIFFMCIVYKHGQSFDGAFVVPF